MFVSYEDFVSYNLLMVYKYYANKNNIRFS